MVAANVLSSPRYLEVRNRWRKGGATSLVEKTKSLLSCSMVCGLGRTRRTDGCQALAGLLSLDRSHPLSVADVCSAGDANGDYICVSRCVERACTGMPN